MWLYFILIIVGFVLLIWSSGKFVSGSAAIANNYGVSPLIIGITIIGFGTSAPEVMVSIISAISGHPGLAVGNALGSNIANTTLVLGAAALVAPIVVQKSLLKKELPMLFVVMLIVGIFMFDEKLSRWDGIFLLVGLVVFMSWVIISDVKVEKVLGGEVEAEIISIERMSTKTALVWVAIGFALLLLSSRIIVIYAVKIAEAFSVSDHVIGLTILAIGTSLPELATVIAAAKRNHHGLVLGNVIGSNIFNLLAVLSVPAIIHPIDLSVGLLVRDYSMMFLTVVLVFLMIPYRGRYYINRFSGGVLVAIYIFYLLWLYVFPG